MSLLTIEQFDSFALVREIEPRSIQPSTIATVRDLDEREEIEPFIRQILADTNDTPHGPAEIVDILTHKVTIRRQSGMAAFIIKGRSFTTVRPAHVAHQIFRLERIPQLKFAVFAAGGVVLDEVKEQFLSTCSRLGCDYCFLDAVDLARVLIAYGFLCPRDGRRIVGRRCSCGYAPGKRIPNFFQHEALKGLADAHAHAQRAGVVVLPPGSGKTRVAAEDARRSNAQCVLYVAHTHEILDVAAGEFAAVFGRSHVRGFKDSGAPVERPWIVLATIQQLSKSEFVLPFEVDYLIVDEFHHAAAASYRRLILECSSAFLLGLTATPFRADRQDIIQLCDNNVVVNFELRTGVEQGLLSPYHYVGCFDGIDYSNIRHNGTRYDVRDLERALIIPERDAAIIEKWKERAFRKPTLAFCCSQLHAQRVAESFRRAGIAAEAYLGTTGKADRSRLLQQLVDRRIDVLCVVDVLNEGADIPSVECLLFLRPTESRRIFYQQLGRGLRRSPGKDYCVIIDFIGNFRNAYRVVEYQGLLPWSEEMEQSASRSRSAKQILNLPLGCEVDFDERVIDLFARQANDPRLATRHNIGRVLLYQYLSLARRLRKIPRKIDVDRNLVLHSELYELMYGSWSAFERMAQGEARDALARMIQHPLEESYVANRVS